MALHALLLMFALFVLYELNQQHARRHRCPYCGVVAGHEPSCPWNLEREERP